MRTTTTSLVALVFGVCLVSCGASKADATQSQQQAARAQQQAQQQTSSGTVTPANASELPAYAPAPLRDRSPASRAEEDKLFDQAARAAWALINRGTFQRTGFATANPAYPFPTGWDIASTLAALYSARGLGYITDAEYKRRAIQLLTTLKSVRLYQGIAYGRNYDARNGELVGPDQKPDQNGIGYSATDVGRMLVVLAVVAKNDPELADLAGEVARRVDGKRVVRDGFLWGTERRPETGKQDEYQEGRIGYEQYAAAGFRLWNMPANLASDITRHAKSTTVLGIPVPADTRGFDRLTSEPFVLLGLELGWDPAVREVALQTLSAQAARFVQTGKVTIVSEDAINKPPHFFYYYCVYCSDKPFSVNVHAPDVVLDEPRWVSTKAAFGWYALVPSSYTWRAVQEVRPALHPQKGWASGVFEDTRQSTDTYSLNTAAVILESALYRKTGKPLIEAPGQRGQSGAARPADGTRRPRE